MLAFFTTIGLGADFACCAGGPRLLLFGTACVLYLYLPGRRRVAGGGGNGFAPAGRSHRWFYYAFRRAWHGAPTRRDRRRGEYCRGDGTGHGLRHFRPDSRGLIGAGGWPPDPPARAGVGGQPRPPNRAGEAGQHAPFTGDTLLWTLFTVLICLIGGQAIAQS